MTDQTMKNIIMLQITNASQMINLEKDPDAAFALIIDGKYLTYTLDDDLKQQFLNLAVEWASVICCRVSPKQKSLKLSMSNLNVKAIWQSTDSKSFSHYTADQTKGNDSVKYRSFKMKMLGSDNGINVKNKEKPESYEQLQLNQASSSSNNWLKEILRVCFNCSTT